MKKKDILWKFKSKNRCALLPSPPAVMQHKGLTDIGHTFGGPAGLKDPPAPKKMTAVEPPLVPPPPSSRRHVHFGPVSQLVYDASLTQEEKNHCWHNPKDLKKRTRQEITLAPRPIALPPPMARTDHVQGLLSTGIHPKALVNANLGKQTDLKTLTYTQPAFISVLKDVSLNLSPDKYILEATSTLTELLVRSGLEGRDGRLGVNYKIKEKVSHMCLLRPTPGRKTEKGWVTSWPEMGFDYSQKGHSELTDFLQEKCFCGVPMEDNRFSVERWTYSTKNISKIACFLCALIARGFWCEKFKEYLIGKIFRTKNHSQGRKVSTVGVDVAAFPGEKPLFYAIKEENFFWFFFPLHAESRGPNRLKKGKTILMWEAPAIDDPKRHKAL
jgi:hypothetical protein